MPSIPRLRTPERSHKSEPSTPNMYGVAMRIAAAQKLAESRMSSTPSIALPQTDVEAHEQPADQHAQERQRDDQVGDVIGNAERAAHRVGAHENTGDEDRGRHDGQCIEP